MLKLEQLSVHDFILELSSVSATPGGGSVAALCGALGAGLSAMVSRLTKGRGKLKDKREPMEKVKRASDDLARRFLVLAQEDTDAYQQVMAALKLPKEREEQKASRQVAIDESMKRAARVPLETLRTAEKLINIAKDVVEQGNPIAITDAGAAVHLARTAGAIAAYNVRINLSNIKDEKFCSEYKKKVDETLKRMEILFAEVTGYVNAQLA